LKGLGLGLTSMQAGERSLLHVDWRQGYGKDGSFSFPTVPPQSDLIYELELLAFEPAKEVSHLRMIYVVFCDVCRNRRRLICNVTVSCAGRILGVFRRMKSDYATGVSRDNTII
jgi:hypothetical protein